MLKEDQRQYGVIKNSPLSLSLPPSPASELSYIRDIIIDDTNHSLTRPVKYCPMQQDITRQLNL